MHFLQNSGELRAQEDDGGQQIPPLAAAALSAANGPWEEESVFFTGVTMLQSRLHT